MSKIFLTIVFFLVTQSFIYSQNRNDIDPPKGLLEISTPHIAHASNVNGESGFSILYAYPGYFSLYGQPGFYYTTKGCDSYFLSVGEVYLMAGIVKNLNNAHNIFLNLNVGTMGDEGFLGSIGISYLKILTDKNKVELVADLFMNPGLNGDMFISDKPSSNGALLFCNYSYSITKNLNINAGLGISYIRYRYVNTSGSSNINSYEYVSKSLEKYYSENLIGVNLNPQWDSHIIFPFGITLSCHL